MRLLIATLILGVSNLIFAQSSKDSTGSNYSLSLGIGHQQIGFPFRKPPGSEYHFYSGLSVSRKWKSKIKQTTYQTLDLGVFQNKSSGQGYFLLSNYGYRYQFTPSIYLSGEAGLGFFHLFRPRAVYELQGNGDYKKIQDWGKIHPAIDFNFQFGYQPNKFGIYLEYRIVSEFLYNQDAVFYPQTFISMGLSYKI